jgi:hypothetical protein
MEELPSLLLKNSPYYSRTIMSARVIVMLGTQQILCAHGFVVLKVKR